MNSLLGMSSACATTAGGVPRGRVQARRLPASKRGHGVLARHGEERGHLVHILLGVALEGGEAGDAHARARARAGARGPGAAARRRGEAGR